MIIMGSIRGSASFSPRSKWRINDGKVFMDKLKESTRVLPKKPKPTQTKPMPC